MKKTLSIILALTVVFSAVPLASAAAGMTNFRRQQTYRSGQFADVKPSDWFSGGVQSAYELGLMKGSSDAAFKPTGNLTVAEALAISCRLHSIYADNKQTFTQGSPWYQVYLDYAILNRITAAGLMDPAKQITREQFAYLMCGAIPENELSAINVIASIPDEPENSAYGPFVYRLYRAGVLTGSDKYGTFKPATAIQRSEVATIVTRMADKGQRKSVALETAPAVTVTEIQLAGATVLYAGDTTKWTASVVPANASGAAISWASGNPGVATVDQTGTITGLKPGVSNITASSSNGVKKTVAVNVVNADSLYQAAAEIAQKSGYLAACNYYEENALKFKGSAHIPELVNRLEVLYSDWQRAAGSPVVIENYSVTMDGSTPCADISVRNLTEKTVVALTAEWTCVDAYGNVTVDTSLYNGEYEGYADHLEMKSHDIFTLSWRLINNKRTHTLKNVRITKLAYADGTTWQR